MLAYAMAFGVSYTAEKCLRETGVPTVSDEEFAESLDDLNERRRNCSASSPQTRGTGRPSTMSNVNFFLVGWEPIVRILVVGVVMYVSLVTFLRLSGSRTIASWNVSDFVVTVAIGSAFGRALTARSIALAEAITAFALLITLQYVIT